MGTTHHQALPAPCGAEGQQGAAAAGGRHSPAWEPGPLQASAPLFGAPVGLDCGEGKELCRWGGWCRRSGHGMCQVECRPSRHRGHGAQIQGCVRPQPAGEGSTQRWLPVSWAAGREDWTTTPAGVRPEGWDCLRG